MTLEEALKEIVLEYVAGACKATELAAHATKEILTNGKYVEYKTHFTNNVDILFDVIGDLIRTGEIIEIEYILPDMDYRVKSFYLPEGSRVRMSHEVQGIEGAN